MGHLGISTKYTREKNLSIILEQYKQDPKTTLSRINFLAHFSWINHSKGLVYPLCTCLRCHALYLIENFKDVTELTMESLSVMFDEKERELLTFKP